MQSYAFPVCLVCLVCLFLGLFYRCFSFEFAVDQFQKNMNHNARLAHVTKHQETPPEITIGSGLKWLVPTIAAVFSDVRVRALPEIENGLKCLFNTVAVVFPKVRVITLPSWWP